MLGLQFRNAHLALRKKSPDYNRKEALRIKLIKYQGVGGYGNPCSVPHVRSSCLLTGASISPKYMYFKSKLHPRSKTLAATYLNLTYNLQLLSTSKTLLRSESAEVLRKQKSRTPRVCVHAGGGEVVAYCVRHMLCNVPNRTEGLPV